MRYVIFGPGRVGANMDYYLRTLGHDVRLISRRAAEKEKDNCLRVIERSDVVAAALPDDSLQSWRAEWSEAIGDRPMVHFSGATQVHGMWSYHPLYSFPDKVLDIETLKSIAFACVPGEAQFGDVFPGMENRVFSVSHEDRAYYHALAVLSGNLTAFIWNETAKAFRERFSADGGAEPSLVLKAYFESIVARFAEAPEGSMTGPLARRDRSSVEANLAALDSARARLADERPGRADLSPLYRAYLAAAWPDFSKPE